MKKISLLFFLWNLAPMIRAQEVVTTDPDHFYAPKDLELYTLPPNHFFPFTPNKEYDDYMNSGISLRFENRVGIATSRFYEESAVDLTNNAASYPGMSRAALDNKGFTFSVWFKTSNLKEEYTILGLGKAIDPSMQVSLEAGRIKVRKKSKIKPDAWLELINFDYPLELNGVLPTDGDMTNGFTYLCITSDAYSCRVYLSRPGGRLYSRMYYFNLIDNLPADSDVHNNPLTFYSSEEIDNQVYIDDPMIYYRQLSPNDVLNVFYLQSPVYKGVSYQFKNQKQQIVRHTSPLSGDGLYEWVDSYGETTVYGDDRFQVDASGPRHDNEQYFRNAGNGTYASYARNAVLPTWLPPQDQYSDYRQYRPHESLFSMYTAHSPKAGYHVAFRSQAYASNPYYLTRDYPLPGESITLTINDWSDDTKWQMWKASRMNIGPEQTLQVPRNNPGGHYVKFRNYNTSKNMQTHKVKYMDWYSGASYYYMMLRDRHEGDSQKFYIYRNTPQDEHFTIETHKQSYSTLSAYGGRSDVTNDQYIISFETPFKWQLDFVKLDENDQPLYAIRTSNRYGTFYMGAKESYCPGINSEKITQWCYLLQSLSGIWDPEIGGGPNKNNLWYIEYH